MASVASSLRQAGPEGSARVAGKRGARRAEVTSSLLDPVIDGVLLSELVAVNGDAVGPRSKRAAILDTAIARFGGDGYEATKWSAIADEVGIGQTALYHYFESKAHCLLTTMRLELARSLHRFLHATSEETAPSRAIRVALETAFDVQAHEISQLRLLLSNGDILRTPRASEREESERRMCLALTHVIEGEWTELAARRFSESGDGRDARVVALAVLGLINSVWRWYRVTGPFTTAALSTLYVDAALRVVG
jgi:AcrR family transcriptional regulator